MAALVLDKWQEDVLRTETDVAMRSGRQVGKTTIISIKASLYALNKPKTTTLIISATERQAYHLFEMILNYLFDNYKNKICKGAKKPTKHLITLTNGSKIYCLPAGQSGVGIRGYTIDLLIADEAAYIPEEVWTAVTPMLAVTGGQKILISTPKGKAGYFYERFSDPKYASFHISSEDCPRIPKEYLEQERKSMTKSEYAQEYLGEFVSGLTFFPDELIYKCCCLQRGSPNSDGDRFLGVDVARKGGDENVLAAVSRHNDTLTQIDMDVRTDIYLTDVIRLIKDTDNTYHFKKIYIDDGGLGVGVFDTLLEDPQTKRRVIPINNAKRSLDWEDKPQKKKTMKEDLYTNLLRLMEAGKAKFFNEPEIILSFRSVQAEYDERGRLRIFGKYTHIVEALIRAAWCVKDKSLNIWIHTDKAW